MSRIATINLAPLEFRKILSALDNECLDYSFSACRTEDGAEMYLTTKAPCPSVTVRILDDGTWSATMDVVVGS